MATYAKVAGGWRVRVRRAGVSASKTFPRKDQAQAWAAEQETEAVAVRLGGLPKKTVGDLFRRYVEEVSSTKRGARWEMIRLAMLERVWGMSDRLLAEIRPADIVALRDLRMRAVSPASVARELTPIKKMFRVATQEWGWLHENPAALVRKPPEPEHRHRRVPQHEIDAILQAAGWDEAAPVESPMQEMVVAFLVAIETAMRSGEILAIAPEHYHRARRVVHVPKSKNGAARDVPLTTRAVALLDRLPARDGRLFSIDGQSRDTLFRKVRDRSGVVGLHFHDTRREGTSRLARVPGMDVLTLARITGHKDLKMLMVYFETDMADVARMLG